MSLFQGLMDWTSRTFLPFGTWGLFILAFIESSFFPVPPDLLLIILAVANPHMALWYALVCTLGSVIGGMFGYQIGLWGEKALLEKFVSKSKIEKVHKLFERYEAGAIFIAGFTPIPYKVFTIAAGVFYINFKKFVLASAASRGLRFFIEAILIMLFGEAIRAFLDKMFNWASLAIVGVVLLLWWAYGRMKHAQRTHQAI